MTPPIVVGVDGSASALHAVRWAATEAQRRQAPLRLVHVCTLVPPGYRESVHLPDHLDTVLRQGRRWLKEAADAARVVADPIEIIRDLRDGTAAQVFITESASARLVVLGSRGRGGFGELLVGSVSVALSDHGHCPIVVVRGSTADIPPPRTGPVVVGVDGSPLSDAAVAFAFDAASARRVPLVAVHAWLDSELAAAWASLPAVIDWDAVHAEEEHLFAEQVAGWQDKYPDVAVRRIVAQDRPAHALLTHGKDAQLIVVGSRGCGAWTGLGLGSVSHALLHHAPCPVAVIRPHRRST